MDDAQNNPTAPAAATRPDDLDTMLRDTAQAAGWVVGAVVGAVAAPTNSTIANVLLGGAVGGLSARIVRGVVDSMDPA